MAGRMISAMTSTTAFVLLILVLLAVLVRQELHRHRGSVAGPRPRLFGSGAADPDSSRERHDLSAIAAHHQSPFVR